MKFRAILLLCAVALISLPLQAQIPGFAKDPAISPDGNTVCFVFDNDLWLVPFSGGEALRLTSTIASEWGPQWSPDGKWIAFNSNREGQSYPYIISSSGGEARVIIRENYSINDWFNDSKHLMVVRSGFEWGSSFYKLPIMGERATLLGEIGAQFASLSPDNRSIVFARFGDAHRERYTGSLNGDLWKLDIASKKYTQLTKTKYTERYPRFSHSSDALYYCYSDSERYQLYKVNKLNFSRPEKLSNLPFFSARDISIARKNDRIVFEHFDEIYKYDPALKGASKVQKLDVRIAEDMWQHSLESRIIKDQLRDYNLSDDELLVSFTSQYDNFLMPRKGGKVKQITSNHNGWASIHFLDTKKLILSYMDSGKSRLFNADIDNDYRLSPYPWFGGDSLSVDRVYKDSKGRWQLHYSDFSRSGRIALADSGFVNLRPINNPWVARGAMKLNKAGSHGIYSIFRDDNYMNELYLYDLEADSHRKLLTETRYMQDIVFTNDENSLLLTMAGKIYRLDLNVRDEREYEKDHWAEIYALDTAKDEELDEPETSDEPAIEEAKTEFRITWDGIEKRLYELYTAENAYLWVLTTSSDSTFYYIEQVYSGDTSIKSGNIYGKGGKQEHNLGRGCANFKLIGSNLYYLQNGALKQTNIYSGKKQDIPIEIEYEYNTKNLNKRVFEEAWGAFGENFYDPNMHGQDWNKLYKIYSPYTDKARSISDIATIIDEMIGDVNASHTGFYPRSEGENIPYKAKAYLGLELDYTQPLKEGIKITRIYPNTRLASFYKIQEGDILLELEGSKIDAQTPIDSLLLNKTGKSISLKIQSGGELKDIQMTAFSGREAYNMYYSFKVKRSESLVEQLSQGKLGYIHVPSMGESDYDKFWVDVFRDNYDKQGLVLDFRGNSGGRIHDKIISLLTKETYAYSTSRRYSLEKRPEPLRGIKVPTIVLVDERSFSDGEIFPIVYKELKLGKVVGFPSSGAVIGTWEYRLLDGSRMRLPGSGWYKMDGTNMEGSGAMPDILVENTPNDLLQGRDKQLERAIHELLKEVK
ncbi:MAG: S41 family peptidase [Candidatus Cloacimonadaceae bacterium]